MKILKLKQVEHEYKTGDTCPAIEPNVCEDCLLESEEGKIIGFYMRNMTEKAEKLADIANAEFRSDRVPKSLMERMTDVENRMGKKKMNTGSTAQMSCILGSVKAQPNMRRLEPRISSVHQQESAKTFVKAMLKLCKESTAIYKEYAPDAYAEHEEAMSSVHKKWLFGDIYTSSICNYNISVNVHIDKANVKNTANIIISKKFGSTGGNLYVPDYDACFDQCDNSILVYPAWRNIHCVTPIEKTHKDGYRNSLVFYPQKCFLDTK